MPRIRVLLAGRRAAPLQSLADTIAAESDMELVDVLSSFDALPAAVRDGRVDVVITERLESEVEEWTPDVLYGTPRLRMLSISVAGPDVVLHELRPHETSLGNMSLDALLRTIRERVQWPRAARAPLPLP